MKNLFIIAILFASFGMSTAIAQNCSHAKAKAASSTEVKKECTKTKAECASAELNDSEKALAIKMAADSENIHAKVCEASGKVSFTQVEKCSKSGKETQTEVNFDPEKKQFVNVSPSEGAESVSTSASAEEKKSCSKADRKKACASKASEGKACCKSKKAAKSNTEDK